MAAMPQASSPVSGKTTGGVGVDVGGGATVVPVAVGSAVPVAVGAMVGV